MGSTTLKVANGFFTVVGLLVGLYALSKWASFALVWGDAWAFSEALTWTLLTGVAFVPVIGIEYLQKDDESGD